MVKKKKKKVTKKAAAKKTTKRKKKEKDMLLVSSKTKESIRAHGCNVSAEAMPAINSHVHWIIHQASLRAKANGRKTVRAHDVVVDE